MYIFLIFLVFSALVLRMVQTSDVQSLLDGPVMKTMQLEAMLGTMAWSDSCAALPKTVSCELSPGSLCTLHAHAHDSA